MLTRREWGWYLTLLRLPWFCIKVLKFDAHKELSMQRHKNRSELWVILKGNGMAFIGWDTVIDTHFIKKIAPALYMVNPYQWHKFDANTPVWVLEFQFGSKCKEEDIERKYANIT